MITHPLVSVGLFVYNGERFLEESLNSILNQTFTNFELIISDNASTDRTGEIARKYAERDTRIRYHRAEKNMGAGWNARRVYELAMGRYFKWAAVDDLIEPDLLRRCVEILESDAGSVVAYARTKEVDEDGHFIRDYVTPVMADSTDPVERFRQMVLIDHYCYQIYGLMRMSALRRIPPQGIYVNGDRVLLARMSLLGRFHEISEPLFTSRHHSAQSTKTLPARLQQPRRLRITRRHSALPSAEWWDPAKNRTISFPEFRQLFEYILSISRSELSAGQKFRCYPILLLWTRMHFKHILKDFLIAVDQILFNLQSSKGQIHKYDLRRKTVKEEVMRVTRSNGTN